MPIQTHLFRIDFRSCVQESAEGINERLAYGLSAMQGWRVSMVSLSFWVSFISTRDTIIQFFFHPSPLPLSRPPLAQLFNPTENSIAL
jgi:hypothetical protein